MSLRHVATCLQDTQCLLFWGLWKKFLLKKYAAKLMTSFIHTHHRNHRIQLMMATVAIVWATMRAPLMVMVGSSSWLLVASWSPVVRGQKKEVGDGDAGGREVGAPVTWCGKKIVTKVKLRQKPPPDRLIFWRFRLNFTLVRNLGETRVSPRLKLRWN